MAYNPYIVNNVSEDELEKYNSNSNVNYTDLSGLKIGRLTVLFRAPDIIQDNGRHRATWWCKCNCNKENPNYLRVRSEVITSKHPTLSCGCLHDEQIQNVGKQNKIHGLSGSGIYDSYHKIIQRCYDPSYYEYKDYGGRGIRVCNEWYNPNNRTDPEKIMNFYNWSITDGKYSENLTIDRIDVDGNYEPSNCRWANKLTQANNKRNNTYIIYNRNKYTISQWAIAIGILPGTIRERYIRGMDIKEILTTPGYNNSINGIYFVDNENNPVGNAIYFEGELKWPER